VFSFFGHVSFFDWDFRLSWFFLFLRWGVHSSRYGLLAEGHEQRISVEKDKEARAIMANAQKEEFKHFGMDLEFLLRRKSEWREIMKRILFSSGDIVEADESAEHQVD
jgi:hypothetical protein